MKTWTGNINIDAPIDEVWKYLDGPLEDMQKIMPNVLENKLIKETDGRIGSVYRQKVQEGKRTKEYDVETLEYINEPDEKKLTVSFYLGNTFRILTTYEVERLENNKTYFRYSTTNEPLKWYAHILLRLGGGNKVVIYFITRVKDIAEKEFNEQ